MPPKNEPTPYHAYLLRCWQVSPATGSEPPRWRFSLRTVSAEPEQHDFLTMAEMMAFLEGDLPPGAGATEPR